MRAYKTVNDSYIEPISFTVPRRAEVFQADIYPPAIGLKPAMSAKEWLGGKTGVPAKLDLESIYNGDAPAEVPADYKPPVAAAPAPAPAAKPAPKPEPTPVTTRAPPPSTSEQKASISAMANKFQDDEEYDDDDAETSSFEEVARPTQRAALPVRSEAKAPAPIKATPYTQAKPPSPIKSPQQHSPTMSRSAAAPVQALASSGASVEASLTQIKQLIEQQTKIINAQSEQIGHLTDEVDTLKKRFGSGSQDQSERIRQLELELEEARS